MIMIYIIYLCMHAIVQRTCVQMKAAAREEKARRAAEQAKLMKEREV